MQFYMPVKVYEEEECVKCHTEVFTAAGSKALLVTGRHSARENGALSDVLEVLEEAGISYALFDAVEENPSIETVMKARAFGLKEKADFVIGIGGGSPMDAAKAIAMMMYYKEEDADYLYEGQETGRLPLILIPTTCGTGSEVTGASVLTIHAKKTKSSLPHKIFADAALIDGKYLASAPISVIRNTAVDALGHLMESWFNSAATKYSRMCAEAGLTTWALARRDLLELEQKPLSPESRENLMRASAFAGMAIAQTGTSLPHALSYPLTYDLHLPHGVAVGYFESGYLARIPENERNEMLSLAGFRNLSDFQDFFETVCGKILIPEDELQHALDAVASNPSKLSKAPFACGKEELAKVVFHQ